MSTLAEAVKSRFPNLVLESLEQAGDAVLVVRKEGVRDLCAALKKDPAFDFNILMDLFAIDYLFWEEKEFRFEVVYNLFSSVKNNRLFLKVRIAESDANVDSVTPVWPAANWYERETWDMFGIKFNGHPNLKRILMYEGFEGHALRKDYPYNKRQPIIQGRNP